VVVVGGTNDVKFCLDKKKEWSPKDYPATVDTLFEDKDGFLQDLSVAIEAPVVYAGAGSAARQRISDAVKDITLGYLGDVLATDAQKQQFLGQAMARFFMLLGGQCQPGGWASFGIGVYPLQKPALSTTLCDKWGHPGAEELYLQALLIYNVMASVIQKAGLHVTSPLRCEYIRISFFLFFTLFELIC
jgi:hypothetical protein